MIIELNHGLAYYQFSEYNTSGKIKRKKKKKRFAKIYNAFDNHVGGGSVVRVWDQEICFFCGLRFKPCGCSYDGHWRLT